LIDIKLSFSQRRFNEEQFPTILYFSLRPQRARNSRLTQRYSTRVCLSFLIIAAVLLRAWHFVRGYLLASYFETACAHATQEQAITGNTLAQVPKEQGRGLKIIEPVASSSSGRNCLFAFDNNSVDVKENTAFGHYHQFHRVRANIANWHFFCWRSLPINHILRFERHIIFMSPRGGTGFSN